MSGELLLLLVGVAFILAAVVDVRPRERSIRLAQLDRWPRIATAATGALCVSAASIVLLSDEPNSTTGPVTEAVTDELDPTEISETVRVFVDGRHAGVLKVDSRVPRARLNVTVARAGRHEYATRATIALKGKPAKRTSFDGEVFVDGKGSLKMSLDPDTLVVYVLPLQ
jgi:hypothetical protein